MTEMEARFSAYPGEARNQIGIISKDNQTQNRINVNRLYYSISSYLIRWKVCQDIRDGMHLAHNHLMNVF